jgi:hypothetical protein
MDTVFGLPGESTLDHFFGNMKRKPANHQPPMDNPWPFPLEETQGLDG